jgi:multidrug efflux pump subunit AcrB
MTILKAGSASTVDIVENVKALLPKLRETLPADLKIQLLSDQSLFVKAAISGWCAKA